MVVVVDTNLKMEEVKEQLIIHLLLLHGLKLAGTLIMFQVVVMAISMLQKVLTLVNGLAQLAVVVVVRGLVGGSGRCRSSGQCRSRRRLTPPLSRLDRSATRAPSR